MGMSESRAPEPKTQRSWARKYPPLAVIGVALLIVLAVLPSALNLPNADPTEVPEYAPVPPEEDQPPPQQSNVSALRLGSTSGLTEEIPATPPPPPVEGGAAENPVLYDCVSGKQTEDPLSPPCSPFFAGDNGGATYQGVTKDEIRVIFYMDGSIGTTGTASYDGAAEEAPPQGTYCDVNVKENSDKKCHNEAAVDHMYVRITRAYQRYLNTRFQTYDRRFHFWVYYSGAVDAGGRRADAADNFAKIKPFAVIDYAVFRGATDAYIDAMARNGVLIFSSQQAYSRKFFNQYDPLVWSFAPDIEHRVDQYVEWICKKVAPYPVAHSGDGVPRGGPRKYAFYYTTDRGRPDLRLFAELARPRLKRECPRIGNPIEATFPTAGYTINTAGDPAYARLNIARLRSNNVTTMLWLGGVDGKTEAAADEAKFYPEVFFAGDGYMEGNATGFYGNRNFHAQVAAQTYVLREPRLEDTSGYQAWRQAEPTRAAEPEAGWVNAVYRDFFMVGVGVQVAGPRLHPVTVAEGFRAIPPLVSDNPFVPACFFTNGHFCVQDMQEVWWDNTGTVPGGTNPTGCYRTVDGGLRYPLGKWPKGDKVFMNPDDPCSRYDHGALLQVGTPGFEE